PLERDWLAGTLWPESSQSEAFANLRNTLHDLRRALGGEAYRLYAATKHTVGLELAGVEADVLAFDAAVADGGAEALARAVGLYRGPLLEGCPEAWVLPERVAREQAYLQALELLAAHARQAGDPVTAVGHLRQVIAVDPLREDCHRALMQALADC